MWKILILFMCTFCTMCVEATYNTGIKTKVYEQQPTTHVYHHHHHQQHIHNQPHTSTHGHYNQHSGANNDEDYQTSISQDYVHTDNSYQQQQHESDYRNESPTLEHKHQQSQQQPVYERKDYSQIQTTGSWQNSENAINQYYTGCPSGHTGQLPYAYDCRRFLNCWHGRGHIQTCSVGTVFNPETLECDRPDKVKCEAALDVLSVQPGGKSSSSHSGSFKQSTRQNYRAGHYTDITKDNVEVLCPVGAEGLQPHPTDCTRFINCANGNMHIQQCGPGTAYSTTMKVCDFRNKVDCTGREGGEDLTVSRQDTQANPPSSLLPNPTNNQHDDLPHTNDILCLNSITGLFPYPFDYTKFINCRNGNTAIQNCVPGTAFSISKGYCESLSDIQKNDHVMYIVSQVSYEYSQTLITCPPGTEGMHLYPFNAELFVKCIKSQMQVVPCNNHQVFSITRRTCLPFTQVLKQERVRLLSELEHTNNYRVADEQYSVKDMIYCPGVLMGTYPHPFDSTKYLKCVRGRLTSESCASGQAFSLSRKICSLKEEMNADDYVAQAKSTYGHAWRVTDMEITHGSIDGLTHLMCPPGLDGYFLHPFDCTKYIQCSQGTTVVDNCLNGAVFSISRKECIPRDKVEAYDRVEYLTSTKNEFTNEQINQYPHELGISCNPGTFGIYPHPHDFKKYIRCTNGRLSVESCAVGEVFSLARSCCHNENDVSNRDRSSYNRGFSSTQGHYKGSVATTTTTNTGYQTGSYNHDSYPESSSSTAAISAPSTGLNPPLPSSTNALTATDVNCPPDASGRLPHPYDCTKFLMCSNGKTFIQSCGPGTAWDKQMETCDYKAKVGCVQGVVTSTINSESQYHCPPDVEGLYQHPYDWRKYLVCEHGQTIIMDCAPGTVFSLSRKTCDNEANVLNTDRCNNGVYSTDYDYSNSQYYNNRDTTQWSSEGTTQSQTSAQVTGNRWTNMNKPRPQGSTYDHTSTTWQQTTNTNQQNPSTRPAPTTVWSGTGAHVDQHNAVHTTIYEEGSFEPNRNYNLPMYNTPLTPLAPLKPTAATTTTTTTVYAQPVDSQEDSAEIFANTHTKPTSTFHPQQFPTLNRQNHTRHLSTWTPIRPVNIPRHDLMPTHKDSVYTNTGVQVPISSDLTPPYQGSQPSSQYPYRPHEVNADSGQKPLSESDFKLTTINVDQLPGQLSYNLDDFDTLPSSSNKHNVNSGLQPSLHNSLKTTTVKNYLDPYEQTTQLPLPPTTTKPSLRIYPQLSNATIQTFPHLPHYSPPYSEVMHSHNVSWVGRKIPQHSVMKSVNSDNTNVKLTSQPPYSNNEQEDDSLVAEDQEANMKAALTLLLKPYLDTQNNVADKAQSHIMNLVSNSEKDAITSTSHKPLLTKNTIVTTTTTPHQDAELILAGEQHNLVGVTTTHKGNHETSTSDNLYQASVKSERTSYPHNHNSDWHKHHSHEPHHFEFQHSREFHEKHPNLPNPFDDPTSSHNPHSHTESKTPTQTYNIDVRFRGECPFDCGNGKCVEQHQVCDGVNNCGNRRDEEECEHLGYELRLTGGQSPNMGRVEVKILGRWGNVCDDKFGLRDADVVCRELGFQMGAMEVRGNSYYYPSDVNVYFAMDEVECKGNETSLKECDFKGWGVNNCGPDEVVGVVCKVAKLKCPDNYWLCSTSKECIPTVFLCDVTPDCEDGSDESEEVCNAPIQYRLEGGRSSNEGRIEVFYRGEWGTICDDDFGLREAQVFCNSFGLYGKPEIVKNIYGPGSGPIWLDQIACLGNETTIDECSHWSWGENNCNHTEDVGIKCTAGPKPNPSRTNKFLQPDHSLMPDEDVQSVLQHEQSELDDLGLYQGLWQRSSKAVNSKKKCGHFKSDLFDEFEHPEERVVNGTVAKRGRHPWQATIRTRGRGGISTHWCGAVIISRKLILTAAHCLAGYPKGSYFVRMGDHYANIAESSEIDSNIENWYIHEKFRDQKHMNNDIALILLKNPVRFNDYVQPVCLPEKGASLEANRMCTISGWGSIKSGTSTPSNILRSAQIPILANDVCSQKNVYANAMTEGMFCAGFLDESADACDGDSGGPLVCSDQDAETLYGIISWGQHCGYANHPGVYVRVEKYIDWIYDKINLMMQQGKL